MLDSFLVFSMPKNDTYTISFFWGSEITIKDLIYFSYYFSKYFKKIVIKVLKVQLFILICDYFL